MAKERISIEVEKEVADRLKKGAESMNVSVESFTEKLVAKLFSAMRTDADMERVKNIISDLTNTETKDFSVQEIIEEMKK